jgi:hypothetical protein
MTVFFSQIINLKVKKVIKPINIVITLIKNISKLKYIPKYLDK